MKRTRSLTATAYHEAAHAVVAHRNGIKFRRITIEPNGDSLGHVLIHRLPKWFQPDVNAGDRARLLAEKRILVKFAGHAAEAKYRGRANRIGASSDYRQAIDFILPFTGNKKEAGLYLTWLAEKASGTVSAPHNWAAIEALASALLEFRSLTAEQATSVIIETTRIRSSARR